MPQQTGAEGGPAFAGVDAQSLRLRVLQERRELLSDQYQSAMTERGRIGQERLNAQARGDAAMVREYDGVVARIGARMQELEQAVQGMDRQIDDAMKSPIQFEATAPGQPGEPVTVTVMPPPPPDFGTLVAQNEALNVQRIEYQRIMVAEGAVLLMLGALLWRFGVARGRRQAARAEPPRDDSKLQQSVDAIAIEVERLSEGQRFINNVMAGRRPEREPLPAQPLPIVEPRDSAWITPH
jgi:hypothetical protein